MDLESLLDDLDRRLSAGADRERALREKAYPKGSAEHVGAPVPGLRKVLKACLPDLRTLCHDDLPDWVRALGTRGVHEHRALAASRLEARGADLGSGDPPLIDTLLRSAGTGAFRG